MDIASEIATYLSDAGFGTVGDDLFVGQIRPDTNGVFVQRIGGLLDNYTPMEETVLNIYAQHTSAGTAIAQIEGIKRYIHRMISTETTSSYIYAILAIGDIEDLQRDEEYKKAYSITVQVRHRDTALIS